MEHEFLLDDYFVVRRRCVVFIKKKKWAVLMKVGRVCACGGSSPFFAVHASVSSQQNFAKSKVRSSTCSMFGLVYVYKHGSPVPFGFRKMERFPYSWKPPFFSCAAVRSATRQLNSDTFVATVRIQTAAVDLVGPRCG